MNAVPGGVCAPAGFRASGVAAGIKKPGSEKLDCALIVSDAPAAVAGTFTANLMKSPPTSWCEQICHTGTARAVFLNSGNANACTGDKGGENVRAIAEDVAAGLSVGADEVCVLSTGVIGVPLPMDRIFSGIAGCMSALSAEGSANAARAIMTTDTVPKEMAIEVPLSTGTVRIGAIAKGSGMISPNMATMFCVITTDAAIEARALRPILKNCVDASFNCISIDNDMSTSDAVLCLANGQAGLPPIEEGTEDSFAIAAALEEVCIEMAKALVKDGEGATKFVEIEVTGAITHAAAKSVARAIAQSQLCKTAFFGQDPNWGRIACAAGYAGTPFLPTQLCLWLGDLLLMENGMAAPFEESRAAAIMQQPEFKIRVSVGEGAGACVFWTSDLSHDYVSINADYRT